jgi:hypothetical protein
VLSYAYNNMQLPLTMNPSEYGEILQEAHDGVNSKYTVINDGKVYVLESDGLTKTNEVRMPKPFDLKWTETKIY